MTRYIKVLFLASAFFSALGWSHAAEKGATVSFGSWERVVDDLYYKLPDGDFRKIDAPTYRRGKALPLAEDSITVYRRRKTSDGMDYVVAGEWPAIPGSRRTWVVLIETADGRVFGVASSDDLERFKPGELRLMNLTPHPIVLNVNDTNFSVDGLAAENVKVRTDKKHRVGYQLAARVPERNWQLLKRSLISVPPDYRGTLIATYSQGFGLIQEDVEIRVFELVEYARP